RPIDDALLLVGRVDGERVDRDQGRGRASVACLGHRRRQGIMMRLGNRIAADTDERDGANGVPHGSSRSFGASPKSNTPGWLRRSRASTSTLSLARRRWRSVALTSSSLCCPKRESCAMVLSMLAAV